MGVKCVGFEVLTAESSLGCYNVSLQRATHISKDYSALIFRVKQSKKIKLLDPADYVNTILWNVYKYLPVQTTKLLRRSDYTHISLFLLSIINLPALGTFVATYAFRYLSCHHLCGPVYARCDVFSKTAKFSAVKNTYGYFTWWNTIWQMLWYNT